MKNLFKKKNNSGLIATIVIGSIAAGAIAYLYLTENGAEVRGGMKKKLKEKGKDMAAGAVSKKTGFSKKTLKKVADVIV